MRHKLPNLFLHVLKHYCTTCAKHNCSHALALQCRPHEEFPGSRCSALYHLYCLRAGDRAASLIHAADSPSRNYWVKLVCEASDRIVTVRFGPDGAKLEKTTETRVLQSDISGPHGIAFSPDRKNFYVSIGHGRPYGTALKYETENDRVIGQVGLGFFPAYRRCLSRRQFSLCRQFQSARRSRSQQRLRRRHQ